MCLDTDYFSYVVGKNLFVYIYIFMYLCNCFKVYCILVLFFNMKFVFFIWIQSKLLCMYVCMYEFQILNEFPRLKEDFTMFLTADQALRLGRYEDYLTFLRIRAFVEELKVKKELFSWFLSSLLVNTCVQVILAYKGVMIINNTETKLIHQILQYIWKSKS